MIRSWRRPARGTCRPAPRRPQAGQRRDPGGHRRWPDRASAPARRGRPSFSLFDAERTLPAPFRCLVPWCGGVSV